MRIVINDVILHDSIGKNENYQEELDGNRSKSDSSYFENEISGWGCNNPTEEVYRSIRQLKGNDREATSIIVSIGTGKPAEASEDQKAFNPSSYGYYIRYAISGALQATDSEKTHENIIDKAHGTFPYYRLNVERSLGDLKLDEFNGKFGKKTLTNIADATTVWLATDDAKDLIEASARKLVEIRRRRAHHQAPARAVPAVTAWQPANGIAPSQAAVAENWQDRLHLWERFVHGVEYQCQMPWVCKCGGDEFLDRRGLRQHLVDRHGYSYGGQDLEAALDKAKKFRLYERSAP